MLPLILGGIAVLGMLKTKRNPLHRGKHGAAARRRMVARVTRAARANKRSRGGSTAVYRSIVTQAFANLSGVRGRRIGAAVQRGIRQGRRNPEAAADCALVRGTKRLASRLFNWHGGQSSGVYEVASNWHSGRPVRIEAVNDAWRELTQSLKRVTAMQGRGYTKRDLADIMGLTRRLGLIAASHEGLRSNPKRRRRGGKVTPAGAAARLAHWRWHHNPTWDVKPGDSVTIRTPHGQQRTGRVVMRGIDGWVLNLGGRSGTPGIATPDNIVSVRRGKRRGSTILG